MIILDLSIGLSIGAIVGYIVRELIGDRLARDRALESIRITEFNKAAATFRAVFIDQIFMLKQNIVTANEMVHSIITPAVLILHDKAKIAFEPFLSSAELEGLNAAWLQYFNSDYQPPKVYSPGNVTDRKELSSIYLRNIEKLLEFAKPRI